MGTTRWVLALLIGSFATAADTLAQLAAAPRAPGEPIAFVTPDRLKLPAHRLHLTTSEANRVADAWVAQVDPSNPRLAVASIGLLVDAPAEVIESVTKRLAGSDRLARLWMEADAEQRGRIRNSQAMNVAKLLDFAPAAFIAELDAALANGDVTSIASAISTAGGFRHLPAEVVTKIAAALDTGKLADQQRRELVGLLRSHPEDLRPVQSILRAWLANQAADPIANQKRDLALSVLLSLRVAISDQEILSALKSRDPAIYRAAIKYLRAQPVATAPPTALSTAQAMEVTRRLVGATEIGDWSDAYELLRDRAPAALDAAYRGTSQEDISRTWPAELAAEWIKRAPDSARSSLVAGFSSTLYDKSGRADCNALRYKLSLLIARARDGQSTLMDFWTMVAGKIHDCRNPLDAEIDEYLLEAAKRGDIEPELARLSRQIGFGSMPDWRPRSTMLSKALAGELTQRLLSSDWPAAKKMILSGIRPSATALEQYGFWTNTKYSQPGLGPEWFLRILQAAGSAPDPVLKFAGQAATDAGLDPVSRATALIALVSTGQFTQRQGIFHSALADVNELVSRTALLLMAQAYDEGLDRDAFKAIDRDLLANTLTRRGLATDAANILPRLVRFGAAYAKLHAEQANWADHASAACFSLSMARPLSLDVGISILDAVTTDDDAQRACVGLLFDANSPVATIARQWDPSSINEPGPLLNSLKALWSAPEFKHAGNPLRKKLAELAAAAGTGQPYTLDSQATLAWWSEALDKELPAIASQVQAERRKRLVIGALLAVPAALLLHLGVWFILLVGYPSSTRLQAVIFWNPFVRKVIGFGYIDLVLLYVPSARRRLFAPFAPEFLRDVLNAREPGSTEQDYFAGSLVQHWPARAGASTLTQALTRPITEALASHRGRVLLLGKSGLGKSTFLRFWLSRRAAEGEEILVYLRADQCRNGVEAEIVKRMKSIGSDERLLQSVLYAGRLSVYIDGYNEVDLATQDAITAFVGDYPHGNILVTSQIPLRGFTGIETFELMPLNREQVREFLTTRRETLPADAALRDEPFERAAGAFLDDVWAKLAADEEVRAFEEILANPMDLTSVALLLSQGRVPDLFALERQQFDAVKRRLQTQGMKFRTLGFTRALLAQRLSDQEDLGALPFNPEVTELVRAKLAQVRTFAEPSGKSSSQEIRFRHDRIRDFFTHFALLEMKPGEQAEHAKDARFAGVFPYLARSMPEGSAEALREQLITIAAHIEDHRVSDSFVREYSWRQRFAAHDPDWMLSYDLPAAKAADAEFASLAKQRGDVEAAMGRLRTHIESARRVTRILTMQDSGDMLALAREMLTQLGAREAPTQKSIGVTLTTPVGQNFLLVALAQRERIRPFHVDLLLARVDGSELPTLVVVNSQTLVAPQERTEYLSAELLARLRQRGVVPIGSAEIYEAFRAGPTKDGKDAFWERLARSWIECGVEPSARKEEVS